MKTLQKTSIEYSEDLFNKFHDGLQEKKLEDTIDYFNEFYTPEVLVNRQYDLDKDRGFCTNNEEKEVSLKKFNHYFKKLWKGENLTGKTIFIFEYLCGYGNYIMFSRYIPMLAKMAGKVIIEISDNLYDLYKYNFPDCEIIKSSDKVYKGKYDYTCYHEYFLNFQKDLETFPTPEGYIKTDSKLIKKFKPIFNTDKLKIGIYHEGSFRNKIDYYYSANELLPLFQNKQYQFYTLNTEISSAKGKEFHDAYNIIELQPYIHNAFETAALMKNMDFVISVDSFAAHLAGALGIKTYLLLHDNPCWRWFNDYYKTPWYNSIRIIRKTPYVSYMDCVHELILLLHKEYIKQVSQH